MLTVVLALFCGPSVNEYCCRYGRLNDAPVPVPPVFHTIVERCCSLNLSLCSPVKTIPSRLLTSHEIEIPTKMRLVRVFVPDGIRRFLQRKVFTIAD